MQNDANLNPSLLPLSLLTNPHKNVMDHFFLPFCQGYIRSLIKVMLFNYKSCPQIRIWRFLGEIDTQLYDGGILLSSFHFVSTSVIIKLKLSKACIYFIFIGGDIKRCSIFSSYNKLQKGHKLKITFLE